MIYGKLDTPSTYTPLTGHPIWDEALQALRQLTEESPVGITELRGKDMYVYVHTYETLTAAECRFEGHRNMIDVQYIIKGGELVDWVLKEELEEDGAFLVQKDFQYYHAPEKQPTTRVHLKAGYFGVFFPEDGHRPKQNDGIHPGVYKAVIKINRALLD
jgi:YhcH/YjgK/YiaL family protein